MGYGFSLPNNPADHYSIAFSPAISAYVKNAKALRRAHHSRSNFTKPPTSSDPTMTTTVPVGDLADRSSYSSESANMVITETSVQREIHWVRLTQDGHEFSSHFFRDLSIAVENPRERQLKELMPLTSKLIFDEVPLSRNKLHVLCATVMMLQKGQAAIRKYDHNLPEYTKNANQIDGARYRESQLSILRSVLHSLQNSMRSYIGIGADDQPHPQILRLQHTFIDMPKSLLKDYRNVLFAGMNTRDPRKLRERGGSDFAFTVWLCGLCVFADKVEKPVKDGSSSRLSTWLRYLQAAYPRTASTLAVKGEKLESDEELTHWFDPVRTGLACEDAAEAKSYLKAIQTVVAKHPNSVYNDTMVTVSYLDWCMHIVRMEGVWFPNLRESTHEKNDDEWVMFMNLGDT